MFVLVMAMFAFIVAMLDWEWCDYEAMGCLHIIKPLGQLCMADSS